jgi:hypothetical protein
MKLLGIISVDSVIIDLLLIRCSAFVRYWRKIWKCCETLQLFADLKKAYNPVKREALKT